MAISIVSFTAEARAGENVVELTLVTTGATFVTFQRLGVSMGRIITVRGGSNVDISSGGAQIFDYEAPQGVPITYRVVVTDGSATTIQDTEMVGEIDYGGDWLMPVGRTELGINVIVEAGGIDSLQREVIRDVVKVVNRPSPLVVSWGRQYWSSTFTFLTLEDYERRRVVAVTAYPIVMFAPRNGFGFDEPVFLSIGTVTEERTTGRGDEPSRRWSIEVQQIERPPADYVPPSPMVTWQNRKDELKTWDTIKSDLTIWAVYAGLIDE